MRTIQTNNEYLSALEDGILYAKKYPRALNVCYESSLKEIISRTDFATQCLYTIPNMEKGFFTGLSVRFTEVLARHFKNLSVFTHVQEYDNNFIAVHGIAHDLENNHLVQVEIRKPFHFKGMRYSESQMNAAIAAATSVAYREAVLKIVPRVLVNKLEIEIKEFLRDSITRDEQFFVDKGISRERLANIDIIELIGIRYSIESKLADIREFFPKTESEVAEDYVLRELNLASNGEGA